MAGETKQFELLQKELIQLDVPFNWYSAAAQIVNGNRRYFRPADDEKPAEDVRCDFDTEPYSGWSLRDYAMKNRGRIEEVSHG